MTAPPPATQHVVVGGISSTAAVGEPTLRAEGKALGTVRSFGGIDFVLVPKGKFLMGSKDNDPQGYDDERPQHVVEVPYDYWIARYPLTNARFAEFIQATGRRHGSPGDAEARRDRPVVNVS